MVSVFFPCSCFFIRFTFQEADLLLNAVVGSRIIPLFVRRTGEEISRTYLLPLLYKYCLSVGMMTTTSYLLEDTVMHVHVDSGVWLLFSSLLSTPIIINHR